MDALDRLYWRLMENVRRTPPSEGGVLSVADVYQTRVPYRLARGELGVSELAEYEHALLRLLSGERGYARLDSVEATEELRRELASPNPILGVYRDYAGVGLRLRPAGASPPPPPAVAPPAPAPPPDLPTDLEATPPPVVAAECPHCSAALPEGRIVNFCPRCGGAVRPLPCSGCGAEILSEWAFCVECGRSRSRAAE